MSNKRKVSRIILWVGIVLLSIWEPLLAGNNSGGAFSTWPDTGQTKCYNDIGEIPCPAPGEPFYGQDAQYSGPLRSYSKLDVQGNPLPDTATSYAMVQDNVTGLVWEMKNNMDITQDYSNPHDFDNEYTWCDTNPETNGGDQGNCGDHDTEDFIAQMNSSGFGGYNDWRLPTNLELKTLADYSLFEGSNPVFDPPFLDPKYWFMYWSSTTYARDSSRVWRVGNGREDGDSKLSPNPLWHHLLAARAVRGGQVRSGNRFMGNQDGTVTDNVTCLQWQKATMDINGDGVPDLLTWQQALAAAEGLSLAGKSDWRLPDINELQSLVDDSRHDPAIDPVFVLTTELIYWSSTPITSIYPPKANSTVVVVIFGGDGGRSWWSTDIEGDGLLPTRAVRGEQCRKGINRTLTPIYLLLDS